VRGLRGGDYAVSLATMYTYYGFIAVCSLFSVGFCKTSIQPAISTQGRRSFNFAPSKRRHRTYAERRMWDPELFDKRTLASGE